MLGLPPCPISWSTSFFGGDREDLVRRRQLIAIATAAALTSIFATVTVATATLDRPGSAVIEQPRPDAVADARPGPRKPRTTPLVIAHRGASAYRPEHTTDAYRLAAEMGADYIEADLVMSLDRQLVARHDHDLATTTDVARHPEFTARRKSRLVNGATATSWFTEDFTVAELKTLRVKPVRTTTASATSAVPEALIGTAEAPAGPPRAGETLATLTEIIELVLEQSVALGRTVGLYLELKLPGYFTDLGLDPEPVLADALGRGGLAGAGAPVFVESFDGGSLRKVHELVATPLIQLLWGADTPPIGPVELAEIHTYAAGIGVDRARLKTRAAGAGPSGSGEPDPVRLAHAHDLEVHLFTFSTATVAGPFPPAAYHPGDPPALADALAEYRAYFRLGIDGVFTDNPDVAVRARG
jgi:glycerophosphoryl diester phosphodiesterase